jgi:hypothetical protein
MATNNTETEVQLDETLSDSDLGLQMAKMHTLMKNNGASDDEIAEALSDWKDLSSEEITERLQSELDKIDDVEEGYGKMNANYKKKMGEEEEEDEDEDDEKEVDEAMHAKAKKEGKVPPQFMKKDKDDDKEDVEETADMDKAKNPAKTILDVDDNQEAGGKKATDAPKAGAKGKVEKPNMKEHIDALFTGEELTEDFRNKATTIFEAAVNERVTAIEEELIENHNTQLAEQVESITDELTTKVDDYLGYVVEQWMKENELAITNGLRTEIAEDFMVGLKNLFEESYIDVPDEKTDLIEELATKVSELEDSLNEQITNNVELRKDILESTCEGVFSEVSRDLADTEVEKLRSLVEGIEYETEEQYREKINVIKESYFGTNAKKTELFNEETQDTEKSESAPISDPVMAMYANAISRTSSPNRLDS